MVRTLCCVISAIVITAMVPAAQAGSIAAGHWVGDDYSGSGTWFNRNAAFNDAAPTAISGSFRTSQPGTGTTVNGHGSVYFDAYSDSYLATGGDFTVAGSASVASGGTNPTSGARAITFTAVFQTRDGVAGHGGSFWQWSGLFGNERPSGGRGDWAMSYTGNQAGGFQSDNSITSTSTNFNNNAAHVVSLSYDAAGVMYLWLDGQLQSTVTSTWLAGNSTRTLETTDSAFSIGASTTMNNSDTWFIYGDMPEARIDSFQAVGASTSYCLTNAETVLLHNHLSSKYNSTLLANDFYAGDSTANGNYDNGVFGIVNVGGVKLGSSGDAWLTSLQSSGLTITEQNSSLDPGEAVMAGHNDYLGSSVASTFMVTTNISGASVACLDRAWYLDVTGSVDVTLTFDLSDAGLTDSGSKALLLYRSTETSAFSVLALGATWAGDQVSFDLSAALLQDGYYTLGLVPEPSTFILAGLGLVGVAVLGRRRKW
jgi:hypothetical protein